MRIDLSRGYKSGNYRLWGWIVTTSKGQFFLGLKTIA